MRRIAFHALLNLIGQAVPLAVGALTIPSTIRWLGPDRFGILALGWVLLGYSTVLDLGLGRAAARSVAAALEGSRARIPTLVGTTLGAQALLGLVAAVVILASAPLLLDRVLRVRSSVAGEAGDALSLLALAAPVVLISSSVRGVLEALRRFDLVNAVRAPLATMQFVLPFVGGRAGWSLPFIVLWVVAVQAVGLVAQSVLCLRLLPSLRHARFELRTLRELAAFGGWVTVSNAVGPILVYIDRFFLGALVSVAAVGYYAAPYEMVTRLTIIPVSVVTALFPVFSARHEGGEPIDKLADRAVRSLLLVVGAVTLVVVALAGDVARIWLGTGLAPLVTRPMQILAAGVLVNALAHVPYAALQATGRPHITGLLHLIELPFHVMLAWFLVGAFGIVGAALAWSARAAVDAGLLFLAARRVGALPRPQLRSRGLAALALGAGVVCLGVGAISGVPALPARVAATALALATLVAFVCDRRDRPTVDLEGPGP